jgi:hypothetical protein
VDAPFAQALQEKVGDELAHGSFLLGVALSEVVDGRPDRETPEGVAQRPVGQGARHDRLALELR